MQFAVMWEFGTGYFLCMIDVSSLFLFHHYITYNDKNLLYVKFYHQNFLCEIQLKKPNLDCFTFCQNIGCNLHLRNG